MLNHDFHNTITLVTGGTKGIGRAIALALLSAGGRVVVTYSRDEEAANTFTASLDQAFTEQAMVINSDVADRLAVQQIFARVTQAWSSPVTHVVNNAGVLQQGDFFDLDDELWDRTLAVNLKGPYMVAQEWLMSNPQGGAMVNIASVGGQVGGDKAPDYAASKAALVSLTRSLARIGSKQGVRVNAVSPGLIRTDIFSPEQLKALQDGAADSIPLGRIGEPKEVAQAVLFLLSDEASYITGHCLNVNGGMYFG